LREVCSISLHWQLRYSISLSFSLSISVSLSLSLWICVFVCVSVCVCCVCVVCMCVCCVHVCVVCVLCACVCVVCVYVCVCVCVLCVLCACVCCVCCVHVYLCVYVWCVCVCVCVCVCAYICIGTHKPEEKIRFPGAGVKARCEVKGTNCECSTWTCVFCKCSQQQVLWTRGFSPVPEISIVMDSMQELSRRLLQFLRVCYFQYSDDGS